MVDLPRINIDDTVCHLRSTLVVSLTNTYHSEYCHNVTAVEPKWLVEVAPQFFKVADANKISKRKRQEKIEPLFNKVCIADNAVYIACSFCIHSTRSQTNGDYRKSSGALVQ